ncbi:hypothetical protein M3Y98_00280200 [Aphelenchoides besseyi]|nr:hypothetical protein M3Y98_00280200 [Aphelenchoides besseyi]KAI6201032.1 hypothetical protein M3Y96_00798200 [Aphelenchoides besseyi]
MLAPIVTKDMKLFPTRPLPAHVKNVRSRAQSLQDFAEANVRRQKQQKAAQENKQRNSRSTGNLNAATIQTPKGSLVAKRQPLDSIQEGVELSNSSANLPVSANTSGSNLSASTSLTKQDANGNTTPIRDNNLIRIPAIDDLSAAKQSPAELCSLHELATRPTSALSTTSEPSEASRTKTLTHGLRQFFNKAFNGRSKTNGSLRCHQEATSDPRSKRTTHLKQSTSVSSSTPVP